MGGLRDWLWRDYERARLEGKDKYWLREDAGTLDGLHYYGSVQGLLLLEWGIDPDKIPDPLAEYEIDAIKIGRHVIRAVINNDPLNRRGYHKASFQKIPGGFWGIAIPKLMRDHQRMCNATARSLANNLGISSGPMVEIEVDRLADGEEIEQLYPWRIIQTKSDKTGRGKEAVRFYQPSSNAAELLAVYEQFERRADDATSIPRYTHGNERVGGAGSTAAGLSMLINNASKGIKLAISSIDSDVLKPIIEETFTFNMLYDPDPTIKGDAQIVARGATAMLTREQSQMRRAEFLGMTNNPIDLELMGPEGRIEVLRASADLLDLNTDKVVPDREQWLANQKEKQEQQGDQPQDPKLIEIQMKMEAESKKLEMQNNQFQQKIDKEVMSEERKLQMQEDLEREKINAEYAYKMQLLEEERMQREMELELEREKYNAQREAEIEKIREQVAAQQEAVKQAPAIESSEATPVTQPPINLVINNARDEENEAEHDDEMYKLNMSLEEFKKQEELEANERKEKERQIINYLRTKKDPKLNNLLDNLEES
jgi:hypothetical protein